MADTVDILIDEVSWTEVSTAGEIGFITNSGTKSLRYIEAATAPAVDAIIGHNLNPKDFANYEVTGGQKIFAKSNRNLGRVTVTPE